MKWKTYSKQKINCLAALRNWAPEGHRFKSHFSNFVFIHSKDWLIYLVRFPYGLCNNELFVIDLIKFDLQIGYGYISFQ